MEARAERQQAALDAARAALKDSASLPDALRVLAESFEVNRPEASTLRAINAVLDKLDNPDKYCRDKLAWEQFDAKERTYRTWKRRLEPLVNAELEAAADMELAPDAEAQLVSDMADAFGERREARMEMSGSIPGREKQSSGGEPMHNLEASMQFLDIGQKNKVVEPLTRSTATGDSVDTLKQKGNELYAAGRYKDAKHLYSRLIQTNPQAALLTNRAACYLQEGKWRKAIDDCDRALEIDALWPRAYERKAKALLELRMYQEALSIGEHGLTHDPKNQTLRKLCGSAKQNIFMESQPTTYESRGGAGELKHYLDAIEVQFQQQPAHEPSLAKLQSASRFRSTEKRTTHRALALEMQNKVDEAVPLYKEGAAHGSTTAMCALSRIFVHGQGMAVDQECGAAWAQRCIDNGPDPAHYALGLQTDMALFSAYGQLGQCYRHGWGVQKDQLKAAELLNVAAEAGDTTSMNNLGSLKQQLASNDAESKEAVSWYRKAAEASYPLGMVNLGWALMDGLGCEIDREGAEQWFNKAANLGDGSAHLGLAKLHSSGQQGGDHAAAVAGDLEALLNLQKQHTGEVTHSAAFNAFKQLLEEQRRVDEGASAEELCDQLLDLDIVPPDFSAVLDKPPSAQIQSHKDELLSILLQCRPLTKIEERAVDLVLQSPVGYSTRELGIFLMSRGQRERATKAFEMGAQLADASAACKLGELLLESGDKERAVKYLRQAVAAGSEEALTKLTRLRNEWDSSYAERDVDSLLQPTPKTPTQAIDNIEELLKKDCSVSDETTKDITAFFRQLAAHNSPDPSSGRLLGDNPFDRAALMQAYVRDNPHSFTGNSLLYASKFHIAAKLHLNNGNLNEAIDVSVASPLKRDRETLAFP